MRFGSIVLTLAVASGFVLSGCESQAPRVDATVPSNVAQIKATPLGSALANYGYEPVANLYDNNKVVGQVFVVCSGQNLTKCGTNLHNLGSNLHPNVYVEANKVTQLEGPHDSHSDNRSYYISVPTSWQDFATLTKQQQTQLLAVMPEVAKNLGEPNNGDTQSIVLNNIGQVYAWVSR